MPRGRRPRKPDQRSHADRVTLAADNDGLACRCAYNLSRPMQDRLGGIDDAIQIARIGLWNATRLWDEAAGVRFSTYAVTAIKRALASALQDAGFVRVSESAVARGFVEPNIRPIPDGNPDHWEHAPLAREENTDDGLDHKTLRRLGLAIRSLPRRQRETIIEIFYKGKLAKDVAREKGISRSAVSLAKVQALKHLRVQMERLAG